MNTIHLGKPPRPATGDGDVILDIDGVELTFRWEKGAFVGVWAATGSEGLLRFGNLEWKEGESGISPCECCVWHEGGGPRVCWSIPCGSRCP
jgi:hypothetical protein